MHSLLGLAYCTGSISTAMLPGSVPGQRPHRLSVICTSCICGIATICCARDDGVYNFLFLVMRMYRMKSFIGPVCPSLLAITTVDLHALRRVSGKHIFASIDLIAMLMSDCFGNTCPACMWLLMSWAASTSAYHYHYHLHCPFHYHHLHCPFHYHHLHCPSQYHLLFG